MGIDFTRSVSISSRGGQFPCVCRLTRMSLLQGSGPVLVRNCSYKFEFKIASLTYLTFIPYILRWFRILASQFKPRRPRKRQNVEPFYLAATIFFQAYNTSQSLKNTVIYTVILIISHFLLNYSTAYKRTPGRA